MKIQLFSNWHAVRILQLIFGLLLTGTYFFYDQDTFTLAFGGILLLQAFLNIGCPMAACSTPSFQRNKADSIPSNLENEEVIYEEIG